MAHATGPSGGDGRAWRVVWVAPMLIGLLLAGCGTSTPTTVEDPATTRASTGPASTAPASTTDSSTLPTSDPSQAHQEDAMVTFAVEGGFTGLARTLRLEADGTADYEVSGRRDSGEVDPELVSEIVGELDRSGLFDQDRTYPAPSGADVQRYDIEYKGVTLTAWDTTVPKNLVKAVQLLEQALRDAGPS